MRLAIQLLDAHVYNWMSNSVSFKTLPFALSVCYEPLVRTYTRYQLEYFDLESAIISPLSRPGWFYH
jgi:hypothetical protein